MTGQAPMPESQHRVWQRMLSGRRLDLLDPRPDDIAIEDIAHGLARVARWNGQTVGQHIFSVAQHSLLVEAIVTDAIGPDPQAGLTALLHDAAEYVVGDLISPFKAVLGQGYKAVEDRIVAAVRARFGLPEPDASLQTRLKDADRATARLEASELAGFTESEADMIFGPPLPDAARWRTHLAPLATAAVETLFHARFEKLAFSLRR